MKFPWITGFSFVASLACAMAADRGWMEITSRPGLWPSSLPVLSPKHTLLVLDMPTMTHLRTYLEPWKQPPAISAAEIQAQATAIYETLATQENVDLKIEWFSGEKPMEFKRSIQAAAGIVRSSYLLGDTTVTRTVLVNPDDETIFVHLLANKPGALSFRVLMSVADQGEGSLRIEDRRQLIRTPGKDRPGGIGAHVWVIPFESDVTPEVDSIRVVGEGEAMILISYAAGPGANAALAGTLKRLGDRHDPGHFPPDPTKIWQGVLAGHLKTVENSP